MVFHCFHAGRIIGYRNIFFSNYTSRWLLIMFASELKQTFFGRRVRYPISDKEGALRQGVNRLLIFSPPRAA